MSDLKVKIYADGADLEAMSRMDSENFVSGFTTIHKLSNEDVKINATALFTKDHIDNVYNALNKDVEAIISIFAGRIANAGIDPEITMKYASDLTNDHPKVETLWASAREVFNVMQAERCNTDIITLPFKLI